jgi:hypothetical protein
VPLKIIGSRSIHAIATHTNSPTLVLPQDWTPLLRRVLQLDAPSAFTKKPNVSRKLRYDPLSFAVE